MDTFYSMSQTHNFTLDETEIGTENLSMKMNRSKLLLSEFGTDSTNKFKSPSTYQQIKVQESRTINQTSLLRNPNQTIQNEEFSSLINK